MTQLTREDWLDRGLHMIAEQGVEAVTIATLCRDLGVTKGSFYHHFKNQKVFLDSVLAHWEAEYTSRFIDESNTGEGVYERLQKLNALVIESFGQYEVHIRAWAQADPMAQAYQARVDARRIAYLQDLYRELLGDDAQARAMAHLVYTTLIGSTSVIPPLTTADFAQMTALFEPLVNALLADKPDE
ncbi:MAG: TetR/AcrR family transcriptional regulator [Chloroflexota bacterium]